LTSEVGRVDLLVRRGRASKKRFGGVLDLGVCFVAHTGRGRGRLPVLSSADLVRSPRLARQELERIALLAYGCEVCGGLAGDGAPSPKLYRLLQVWLQRLEDPRPIPDEARVAFEAKALTFAGLTPALVRCPVCADPLVDPACFDLEAGGGVHAHCGAGPGVRVAALRQLEGLRRQPLAEVVGGANFGATWRLSEFIQHQLGRRLKSRTLVEEVVGDLNRG